KEAAKASLGNDEADHSNKKNKTKTELKRKRGEDKDTNDTLVDRKDENAVTENPKRARRDKMEEDNDNNESGNQADGDENPRERARKKQRVRTVYIAGFKKGCDEATVRDFFKSINNDIREVRLKMTQDNRQTGGWGFLELESEEAVEKALELNGTYVGDRW